MRRRLTIRLVVLGVLALATTREVSAQLTFAVAPSGLQAAYAMSDGTDASGNGRTATLTGVTTAPGKYGSAQRFTGASPSHMTIPAISIGGAFTIEAWVFINTASSRVVGPAPRGGTGYWQAIVYQGLDNLFLTEFGDGYFSVGYRNASGAGGGKDGVVQLVNPTGTPYGAWHHVAGVYDGATLRLLIDGVQSAAMAATGVVLPSPQPIEVGGSAVDQGWLGGVVDDVRIYGRALTNAEIASDMATPVDTVREPVVSWDMEVWPKGSTPATGPVTAQTNFLKSAAACNLVPLPPPVAPTVTNPTKARVTDPDVPTRECELIIQTFIDAVPVGIGYTSTMRAHGMTTQSERSGTSNAFDRVAQAVPPLPAGTPIVR